MQQHPAVPAIAPPVAGASSLRWGGIALYVALACAFSWVLWLGLGALGVALVIRAPLGMFGPAIAATDTPSVEPFHRTGTGGAS